MRKGTDFGLPQKLLSYIIYTLTERFAWKKQTMDKDLYLVSKDESLAHL